jgi:2-amino-4-hydroxy-6-hydroxymethyldihydropteridine diphosphokinase
MIFLALGSNLHGPWGSPADALDRAVEALAAEGVAVVARSRWYRSAPYGGVAAGDFVNGVVAVATHRPPEALMRLCHRVERAAGRARRARWGSRTLDLDLIAYHDVVMDPARRGVGRWRASGRVPLTVPHPDMASRAFVLVPLREIAPGWHHPVTGLTADAMLRRLRPGAEGRILEPV